MINLLKSISLTFILFTVILHCGCDNQTNSQLISDSNPCDFMSASEKRERDINGYKNEISLGDAIKLFNKEKQCDGLLSSYPPLTEDEFIAAIIAGPEDGKQGSIWSAQREVLWRIVSQKTLPKGALIIARTGGRLLESPLGNSPVSAKGITISLILELDKTDMLVSPRKPEQAFIIRKTYSQVEAN